MALDPVVNFFRSTIATLPVASGGTSIVITTGDGAKLPDPAVDGNFNLTIYNEDDPFDAPEIVRVTAISGDTLTVTRAQEGTSATNKTSGNTWYLELTPTAKTIQDIDSEKLDVADVVDDLTSTDTDKALSANQGKVLQDGKLNLSGGTMTGDLTIPDKIIHSGDTNTAIRFPANDTVAVETGGAERMRVDSSGNVGIGTDSPATKLEVSGTGVQELRITSNVNAVLRLNNGGGSVAYIQWSGAGSAPLSLYDTNATSDRLIITSTGIVQPGADNTQTLGSASKRWSEVFAGNGTINTSDATEKQEVAELSEAEQQVATALKGLIRKYRWISSVAEKGDDARIHVGVMAQDVKQAFADNLLDAERYGVYCKDTWYTKEKTYTEQIENPDFNAEHEESEINPRMIDGDEKTRTVNCESDDPDATEHVRYGVRYDQLFAFIISAL